MRLITISANLGSRAPVGEVERAVRAIRVASDLGLDAELRRVRRVASAKMRFPIDAELIAVVDLYPGDIGARAERLMQVRASIERSDLRYRRGWDWLTYARVEREVLPRLEGSDGSEYERVLGDPSFVFGATAFSLDVLDPILYDVLVAREVAQSAPSELTMQSLTYRNPVDATVAGIGAGVEVAKKTAGIVETLATLRSRKRIKDAEGRVAEAGVEDTIESNKLNNELKKEELRRLRLANDATEAENRAAERERQMLGGLDNDVAIQLIATLLRANGQLDEADAAENLRATDASALLELTSRDPSVEQSDEPDPS